MQVLKYSHKDNSNAILNLSTFLILVICLSIPTLEAFNINSLSRHKSKLITPLDMTSSSENADNKFHFSIDRGGTFTDVHCILPNKEQIVRKLLSEDPDNYADAPTEGIRRILKEFDDENACKGHYTRSTKVYTGMIGSIRMGTTVATNALLERKGERMGLLITKGFKDLLKIGNQSRQDIFDLSCQMPSLLYEDVVEVDERVMLAHYFDEQHGLHSTMNDNNAYSDSKFDHLGHPKAGYGHRYQGLTGETVIELKQPDLDKVKLQLEELQRKGIKSIAIVFAHSYTYDKHEQMIGKLAQDMGCFSEISMSSKVMPMVKLVNRGHTACAAAYLTPKITTYLDSFRKGFDENLDKVMLNFMKSDGGLSPVNDFSGEKAILSGKSNGWEILISFSSVNLANFFSNTCRSCRWCHCKCIWILDEYNY